MFFSQTDGLLITFANIYAPTAHEIESGTAILFTANENAQVHVNNDLVNTSPKLFQNYPNPFNPETTISFSIQNNSNIELSIFNIKGQKIKTLINEQMQKGEHSIIWSGFDENNKPVSSGIYLYKIKSENQELVKRMLLLK